jgi:hypothetical protein
LNLVAGRWQFDEKFKARMQAKDDTARDFVSVPVRAIGRHKSHQRVEPARHIHDAA